jgi:predicted nucleotidyltransferase component of viral defense system
MEILQEHESFQMSILQWLRVKRLLNSLVFGGGTMLRLCHELPRYSMDMDFWFLHETDYDEYYRRIESAAYKDYTVTDSKNKFYSMVIEIKAPEGVPKVKIEIRKAFASSPGSSEEKIAFSPHFSKQVLVRGFTLYQMMRNKVLALIERGEIRDAFDLEFLARKGIVISLSGEEKEKIIQKLRGFKKRDFDVKLGSLLLPELRKYYRERKFSYLEERLSFDTW